MKKLKEGKRKDDVRWKIANVVVRVAERKRCAIVLERFGKNRLEE